MWKFAHELIKCKLDDTGTFKLYLLSIKIHLCHGQNETLLGHHFYRYATATFGRNVKD